MEYSNVDGSGNPGLPVKTKSMQKIPSQARRETKKQLELDVVDATKHNEERKEILLDKYENKIEKNNFLVNKNLIGQVDDIERRLAERTRRRSVSRIMNRTTLNNTNSDTSCIEFNNSFMGNNNAARNILGE